MAKNGLRGSSDPSIDDHIDALHPGNGPATPTMQDARATQRKIMGTPAEMPPESFNAKVRRQAGKFKSFGDTVQQGLDMLSGKR